MPNSFIILSEIVKPPRSPFFKTSLCFCHRFSPPTNFLPFHLQANGNGVRTADDSVHLFQQRPCFPTEGVHSHATAVWYAAAFVYQYSECVFLPRFAGDDKNVELKINVLFVASAA